MSTHRALMICCVPTAETSERLSDGGLSVDVNE